MTRAVCMSIDLKHQYCYGYMYWYCPNNYAQIFQGTLTNFFFFFFSSLFFVLLTNQKCSFLEEDRQIIATSFCFYSEWAEFYIFWVMSLVVFKWCYIFKKQKNNNNNLLRFDVKRCRWIICSCNSSGGVGRKKKVQWDIAWAVGLLGER